MALEICTGPHNIEPFLQIFKLESTSATVHWHFYKNGQVWNGELQPTPQFYEVFCKFIFCLRERLPMLAIIWSYFVTAAKRIRESQIRKYIWLIYVPRSTKLNPQVVTSNAVTNKLYSHLFALSSDNLVNEDLHKYSAFFDTVAYDRLGLLEEPLSDRFISLRNQRTFTSDFFYSLDCFYFRTFCPSRQFNKG